MGTGTVFIWFTGGSVDPSGVPGPQETGSKHQRGKWKHRHRQFKKNEEGES
jgi:hypothetical protein